MKSYTYKAKKGPDDIIEGKVYAHNTRDAVDKIARDGYIATFVEEEKIAQGSNYLVSGFRPMFGVRLKELVIFTKQLANLIRSGVPILRAFGILSEETRDPYFRHIIDSIAENIKNGDSLSSGLKDYPKVFSSFYRAMVSSGENSGALHIALVRIADYYKKKHELASKVKIALAYPILILVAGSFTLIFVFTNVIPRLLPLILSLNVELPLATKMLIWISSFIRGNWVWITLGALIVGLISSKSVKNETFKLYLSRTKLKLPLYGNIVMKAEIAQFVRALAMAIRSGIPIVHAVNISVPILDEYGIIDAVKFSLEQLKSGGSFADALKQSGIFPPFVYNLIKVGEESGDIEDSLINIAESYEADCEEAIKIMTNLLEPAMVLIVGAVVGFIVFAVLLPIFKLNVVGV